jgi:polyphosphate kinase
MDFPKSVFTNYTERPKPFIHPLLTQPCRIMSVLDQRDVMLHLPYHSFDSVIDLLREAAIDPFVQSIKITCYRLAKNSKIINALLNAVRNGKEVTVVLELRARFDEEANLHWKSVLEEEGVKVLIGMPNMKVHAKLCVIKKKQFNRIKYYGFVSTGNFNESTSKVYGDHLLFTSHAQILRDVNAVFTYLEKPMVKKNPLDAMKILIASPNQMRPYFLNLIQQEIKKHKSTKQGQVIIKLNSLVDEILIEKLYDAAKEGLSVHLVIRGICCALTELSAFKKPIQGLSIVDQYLEHARVFIFGTGKNAKTFISSADWMVRNLDHRIEIACPILDPLIAEELQDILTIQLQENVKGRILDNEQVNTYVLPAQKAKKLRSQTETYTYLSNKKYL